MGRGDTAGLLRAWLGGGCWVSLPRGPLPALGFMTGGSWFSFGSFGLWGWRLPRHCPHSRGGGGSWWRAAGRRGWAVGWGRGGQRPAGARVWLGQAGQDGGRWEPRVRREQAGGARATLGLPVIPPETGQPVGSEPWASESGRCVCWLCRSVSCRWEEHAGLSFPVCTRGWVAALFTPSGSCEASVIMPGPGLLNVPMSLFLSSIRQRPLPS